MKKLIGNLLLFIAFLIGLGIMAYPTISNIVNNLHQSELIDDYNEVVKSMDDDGYNKLLLQAYDYNENIYEKGEIAKLSKAEMDIYNQLLNPALDGIMGIIEIPKISITLPIGHGVDENNVLQKMAGHFESTSLPVGGKNTHAIITAHRGLPTAKLFTDLDKLVVGDIFIVKVLNQVLTYEVDEISVILPTEMDDIQIVDNKDYVTLVTCTPYAINTHRLLVRGKRIETVNENIDESLNHDELNNSASYILKNKILIASIICILLFIIIIGILVAKRKRR